jgi:predicted permease
MLSFDRIRGLYKQLRSLVNGRVVDAEMDEELAFHIEMETRANIENGMSGTAARRAALLSFHGVDRTKELVREARWTRVIAETLMDARIAARSLRRTPSFTLIALTTLSLGIAANGTIFGLLNALLFRPPTGVTAKDVVWVSGAGRMRHISYANFQDIRADAEPAVDVAAYLQTDVGAAAGSGDAIHANADLVSDNYFAVLRVPLSLGRAFVAAEDGGGGNSSVVVLGNGLWRKLFGADPSAVGRVIRVNGHPFTVIGVAAPGFTGTDVQVAIDMWVPAASQPLVMPRKFDVLGNREFDQFDMVGRLMPGANAAHAEVLLTNSLRNVLSENHIKVKVPAVMRVSPMRGWVPPGQIAEMTAILAAAWITTSIVLLIVCANIANLLLSRSAARQREFGVRAALGARRGRIIRMFTVEALVLSFAACFIAVFLAWIGGRLFQETFLASVLTLDVAIDIRTLAFSMAAATGSALLFGTVPALRFSRPDVMSVVKGGTAGLHRTRAQQFFVIAQVALSVVLLVTGALFVQRMRDAARVDPGFDASHVVLATFDVNTRGYTPAQETDLFARLHTSLSQLPGVVAVTAPSFAPFSHAAMFTGVVLPENAHNPDAPSQGAVMLGVSPEYFRTLSIPLVDGRYLNERDDGGSAKAAVVSETFARMMWKNVNPTGRQFFTDTDSPAITVVGLVRDARMLDLNSAPEAVFYLPYSQTYHLPESSVLLRTSGDPGAILGSVRSAVRGVDPDLALFDLAPLSTKVDEKMRYASGFATIVAGFSVLALVLSGIGLYGLVSFSVVGRTREIGVRMALGARPATVVRGFIREAIVLSCVGLVVGGFLAFGFGKLLATAVDGIGGANPLSMSGVAVLLLVVGVVASAVPALRAGQVDPMTSLRAE